ncbi:hypothetical protein AAFF_G00396310 [Aldrovandia affinis]|uniref:Uncharacterized protein n=1 Tax=Aldrovandia affinis TaxID=143900 RepID=A0AAD7SDW1_9TELE|nr:hypothetical protein AAFF_G00396310 [Aldrovandia affinis]
MLISNKARISLITQLDDQEHRISQQHRELQQSQPEPQQGHIHLRLLNRDLQAASKQTRGAPRTGCEAGSAELWSGGASLKRQQSSTHRQL